MFKMRHSVMLLCTSLLGIIGGAALIGTVAIGVAIIVDSLAVGVYALLKDDGTAAEQSAPAVTTLHDILERARAA